jgi:ribosome maturation factor RimP
MSAGSLPSRLQTLLEPAAAAAGYDLEQVTVSPAGSRRVVRILVDRDGGVTLDDVAELSRVLSELLDGSDALGIAPYVLEVGSPGIDRPLTLERHWRRAAGRLVKVAVEGGGTLTARVLRVEGGSGAVVFESAEGGELVQPLTALGRGAVQVEFNRPGADPLDDQPANDEPADDELEQEEAKA